MKMRYWLLIGLLFMVMYPIVNAEVTPVEAQYTKLFDIEMPSGYDSFEAMTITDKYIVVAAVKSDGSEAMFLVFDKVTYKPVNSLNMTTKTGLGRINDMSCDEENIYVLDGNKVHILNKDTLEVTGVKELSDNLYGIHKLSISLMGLGDDSIILYSADAEKITSSEVLYGYNVQGISMINGYYIISSWTGNTPIDDLPANTGVMYVYDTHLDLSAILYTSGKGKLEAVEADELQEYLLFQKDNVGSVYVPKLEAIDVPVTVNIDSNTIDKSEVFKAKVTADGESEGIEIVSQNGVFTIPEMHFIKPEALRITVEQIDMNNKDINYDKEPIEIVIAVLFDPTSNKLVGVPYYKNEKYSFNNEYKGKESLSCVKKDGKYYDSVGKEVSESEYRASCNNKESETENPQTGRFVDGALAIAVIIMVFVIHMFLRKSKLYKIS